MVIKTHKIFIQLVQKHPEYNWTYSDVKNVLNGIEPKNTFTKKEGQLIKAMIEAENQIVLNNVNKIIKSL